MPSGGTELFPIRFIILHHDPLIKSEFKFTEIIKGLSINIYIYIFNEQITHCKQPRDMVKLSKLFLIIHSYSWNRIGDEKSYNHKLTCFPVTHFEFFLIFHYI